MQVADIVGIVPTADGRGYWMVGSDGGVFAFGDAGFVGSLPGLGVQPTPSSASRPTAAARGTGWSGPTAGSSPSATPATSARCPRLGVSVDDIVGIAPTADANGYLLAGAHGGVFAFGDAIFAGSLGGLTLSSPIVAVAASQALYKRVTKGSRWAGLASVAMLIGVGTSVLAPMGSDALVPFRTGIAAAALRCLRGCHH